jgi:uncharacterized protein YegL
MTKYLLKKQELVHSAFGETSLWMIKNNGNIIELNESAQFIINLLMQDSHTTNSIVEAVCTEYDVDASECQNDVTQAIDELVNAGLLEGC